MGAVAEEVQNNSFTRKSFINDTLKVLKGDFVIWFLVILLSIFSIITVYSASRGIGIRKSGNQAEMYIIKHIFLVIGGLLMMYLSHKINYKFYAKFSRLFWILSIPLLLVTFFLETGGQSVNGAGRWVSLPGGFTFQSSDIAKLALFMYLALNLVKKKDVIKDFKKGVLPVVIPVIITCGMIFPSNFSTAALVFMVSLMIMYIGRVRVRHLALISGFMITCAITFILLALAYEKISHKPIARVDTWVSRITNFRQKDSGKSVIIADDKHFQSNQANIAIARGGFFGVGAGSSIQRNFLPNAFSDFIYAIIIEEYGLIGGVIVMFIYLFLLQRSLKIVLHSPKAFGALLAVALTLSLVVQALINMAVAVQLLPVTGLNLPMISSGGTSLIFTSITLGIVLSASRNIEEKENLETV